MSSISSITSYTGNAVSALQRRRPDPAEMAGSLFAQLDASGQGYIEKTDLAAALEQVSSASAVSSDVDDLFSQLDTDADGKVTEQEFTDVLQQLSEQLDAERMARRMEEAGGAGMMPPPPPPPAGDQGYSEDELTAQLSEIGSSDSRRSSLISNILDNFSTADSDGDGRVNFDEAMAFEQSAAATASSTTAVAASDAGTQRVEPDAAQLMMQIVRLMQAYGIGQSAEGCSGTGLSVSA